MSKILLVYDDFAELNATELSLKKATFDVIGLTNEYTLKDQIISFNPEILIGFGNTQRVSSLSLGKKLKEMTRWTGKSVLIFPKDFVIPADDLIRMRMDMLLESPISVVRLIQIICKLLKQDEKAILGKLAKSFAKDRTDDLAFASFDTATVKVIQHIQGELEKLDSDVPKVTKSTKVNTAANDISISDSIGEENEKRETKKSFFEKDTESPIENSGDPFAALISELKGEAPGKASEKNEEKSTGKPTEKTIGKLSEKSENKSDKVAANTSTASVENEKTEVNYQQIGQDIANEVVEVSAALADKIKKYTEMSAEIHLYPESTIKKVKAKKALKALVDDWDETDLKTQDQSRREFVERLFASKKDKK